VLWASGKSDSGEGGGMKGKDIALTDDQRKQLEKLWFVWGNRGSKHSMGNHKFIQRFLDSGEDHRDFYKPDTELIALVDKILHSVN
jgi:hypothetical protein